MEYLKEDCKFGQICVDDHDNECVTYGHIVKVKDAAKKAISDIGHGNKFGNQFNGKKLSSRIIQ